MHERLSVHQICFAELPLADYFQQCVVLGAHNLGFISPALLADNGAAFAKQALTDTAMRTQSITHVFRAGHLSSDRNSWNADRDNLSRLIDIAAELGAESIYMLTGGHGEMEWQQAADCFSEAIAPCVDQARSSGISLAIENASCVYADLHIAHTLADTLRLAEQAGIGVCIELFFCWAEADLTALFTRAMPRCHLVQVSDYVYGDRALPARAVPGDGAIPLKTIIGTLLRAGYRGVFDLELLGPRIAEEGAAKSVKRAAEHVGEILSQLELQSAI